MDLRGLWRLGWCVVILAASRVEAADAFAISSPDFANGRIIPQKYSYHGGNVAPELRMAHVPANTKSLVLIVDDPDAPSGLWTHWTVWNIPVPTYALYADKLPAGAVQGKNSFGHVGYDGPAPPNGTHRYFFRLYALNTVLSLPEGSSREALDAAMVRHVIGHAELFGTYSQKLTVSE